MPGVDGLDIGFGYARLNNDLAANANSEQNEGTVYAKYAYGPLSVGVQVGAVAKSGLGGQSFKNQMLGISYAVSDDLSVSYNMLEARRSGGAHSARSMEQDFDSVSLSYSMGGMTIGYAFNEVKNPAGSSTADDIEASILNLSFAF